MNAAVPDLFDILAVIFGVWLTIRKLDVSKRSASDFPAVDPARFEQWRGFATAVYSRGSWACFLKIVLDLGFTQVVAAHVPLAMVRPVGASIDLGWAAMMILTVVQSSKVRRERDALGIDLR